MLSRARRGGVRNRGRRSVRQLSNGTGCCRARGGGRAKSWLPKSWQALRSVHLGVEMPLPKSWMSCSKLDKLLHGCPAKPSALLMDSQCRRSGPSSRSAHLHWNLSGRQALQVPRGEALRWTSE